MSQDDLAAGGPDEVRHLLGRGSLYTLGTAAQLSAGILVLPALTRTLSPAELGPVAAAIVVTQLLARIASLGIPGSITRAYFDGEAGPGRAHRLVADGFLLAVGVTVLAEVTGPWWSAVFSDLEYGAVLRLAVWTALPQVMLLLTQAYLRADERPLRFVVSVGLASLGAQALGLAAAVSTEGDQAVAYLTGFLVGTAVAAVYSFGATRTLARGVFDRTALRWALTFGGPLVPHTISLYFLSAGDRVIVERLEGLGAVGRYQAAYVVGALALYLVQAVNNAWVPIVLGAPDERRWDVLASTTAAVQRLVAVTAAGIALGAPVALAVVAPDEYRPADLASVAALVAPAALFYVVYSAGTVTLFHHHRTAVLAWATPLSAAVNVGLNFALIPALGLDGAAVSTVVTYGVQAFVVSRAAARLADVPWRTGETAATWGLVAAVVGASLLMPTSGAAWVAVRLAGGAVLLVVLARTARSLLGDRPGR